MNTNLEKAIDRAKAAPEEHQEKAARAVLEALDREAERDSRYRNYVDESLRAAEADITAGRVQSAATAFDDMLAQFDRKYGGV